MTRTALLIIDMQQGLCEGEGAAFESAPVIARLNRVATAMRARHAPVFFIQHESGPGYLERGTPAWELAKGLDATPNDERIRKTTPDSFLRTTLQDRLIALGVTELIIGGMHSEFCVDTTTRRALALGYPVTLIADGHTSAGNDALTATQVIAHHNATLANITSFGPRVRPVTTEQLLAELA